LPPQEKWEKNAERESFVTIEELTSYTGGAEEIRTLDPHVANVVLYQLSYRPF
jgi:hypothetical protein